jgi:predicted transcriptional regulator
MMRRVKKHMLPRKLDITIALKMINLMPELSGTDKRVASAIIDHFNRKTAQYDPSIDRLAWLLGLSRRTVIRSLERVAKTGVIRRIRHGGHLLRNSYEPIWSEFRNLEAAWRSRFNAKGLRFAATDVSPRWCLPGNVAGDESGTQTLPINQSKESSTDERATTVGNRSASMNEQAREDPKKTIFVAAHAIPRKWTPPSAEALRTFAERRWNTDLNRLFASKPEIYAAIIGAFDLNIQNGATDAEIRHKGAGIAYILRALQAKNIIPDAAEVAERLDEPSAPSDEIDSRADEAAVNPIPLPALPPRGDKA